MLPLNNRVQDIITYLGALRSGQAILPYDRHTPSSCLRELINCYQPDCIAGAAISLGSEYMYAGRGDDVNGYSWRRNGRIDPINRMLTLMLSTSGTTGSRKLVRLSASNLNCNAMQISSALSIASEDRAVTSLPLLYVYGLSILNSHLAAGASVVVETRSVMEKRFWNSIAQFSVTSFAGVPRTYEMLRANAAKELEFSTLKKFTTSGAKLGELEAEWLEDKQSSSGALIYYMYGQTEASGRIAVLPAEMIKSKRNSVGKALLEGQLRCAADGSIIYTGPNVMLGYASGSGDLYLGDTLNGVLDTGDLGYLDDDGCLFLTGRKSRVCKLYGLRINLDDIQLFFRSKGYPVWVADGQDQVLIRCAEELRGEVETCASELAAQWRLPTICFVVQGTDAFYPSSKLLS